MRNIWPCFIILVLAMQFVWGSFDQNTFSKKKKIYVRARARARVCVCVCAFFVHLIYPSIRKFVIQNTWLHLVFLKNICKLSGTFHYLHFICCCVTASILSVQQPHNMASRFIVDSEIQLVTCLSLSGAAKFIHIPLQLSSSLALPWHVDSARTLREYNRSI